FSGSRRHTRFSRDWSSDVCSSDLRGLSSVATPDDLASAPTTYPTWVTDRYLELGDTVTPRTIDLAMQVVEGATDPYTQAKMVERSEERRVGREWSERWSADG